jgi:hypothetical protein
MQAAQLVDLEKRLASLEQLIGLNKNVNNVFLKITEFPGCSQRQKFGRSCRTAAREVKYVDASAY